MRRRQQKMRQQMQRGMALILVLWIVAALAIFATSLGRVVRQEAAVGSVTRNMVSGRAAGEAAIFLLLQQMVFKPTEFNELRVVQVPWGSQTVEVEVIPWSGLVNINAASQGLLNSLFSRLGIGPAAGLAQAMVEFRQVGKNAVSGSAWETPEDLLQIPGMTYGIYAQIRPFVVADIDGRAGVNPKAAPAALMQLLDGAPDGAGQGNFSGSRFRLTARIVLEGQGAVMVTRDVDVSGGGRRNALPWTLLSATQAWAGRM